MTYGQIIAEALRLMFASAGEVIGEDAESIAQMRSDPRYADHLDRIPGAFARCLGDLEAKGVIPWKSKRLTYADGEKRGGAQVFELSLVIPDCFELEKVGAWEAYSGTRELFPVEDYELDGDELIIYGGRYADAFVVKYTPCIPRMTADTDMSAMIELPEAMASAIPYFIKGDLYESEEPGEAAKARNLYEQMVEAYHPPHSQTQGRVVNVYGL